MFSSKIQKINWSRGGAKIRNDPSPTAHEKIARVKENGGAALYISNVSTWSIFKRSDIYADET